MVVNEKLQAWVDDVAKCVNRITFTGAMVQKKKLNVYLKKWLTREWLYH